MNMMSKKLVQTVRDSIVNHMNFTEKELKGVRFMPPNFLKKNDVCGFIVDTYPDANRYGKADQMAMKRLASLQEVALLDWILGKGSERI